MTESLSHLSPQERERLLDAMQDRMADGAAVADPFPVPGPDELIPASFAQRRLWFLDRLEPGSSAYNVPLAVRLRGPLDADALAAAIDAVVARHDVLRTTFTEVDGEPVQRVTDERTVRLCHVDAACAADVASWIASESYRPFDLGEGPLLRCTLLAEDTDRHVLLLVAHHTVVDGWSLGLLLRELDEHYRACRSGRAPDVPRLSTQYAGFTLWQRQRSDQLSAGLDFWRTTLDGAPPVLDLPTDRPVGESADRFAGATASAELGAELTARIETLAAERGGTVFMLMFAAFSALLGRLAGTEDIVVGAPVAGRQRPELEHLVGCFVNTLALRADLSGDPSFRELIERVKQRTTEAFAHQDVPFEQVVDAVNAERSVSHSPIYQVLVNYTETVPLPDRIGDLAAELLAPHDPPSKLPITLYIADHDDGIRLDVLYQSTRFDHDRITGLLDQFAYLLDQVTAEPDRPLSAVSLVSPAAAAEPPDPAVPLPARPQPDVAALIEPWVRDTPDAVAVSWRGHGWDYRSLWEAAARIRSRLLADGAGGDAVVAVTGPRSPGLVAAMVAVLTGGGVLLTVDPALPRLRRNAMLTAADATHLVLVADSETDVSTDALSVLRVAAEGAVVTGEHESEPDLADPRPAREAAYLVFTSGTTGTPKGVLGRADGLSHFLRWQRDTFGIGPGDRCAQLTGLSFDVVLRDVLVPLVSGATLVIPEDSDGPAPERTLTWLAERDITVVHTVPSLAESWLACAGDTPSTPPAVRLGFFAGEPLTGELVRAWRAATGAGAVINLYGPTETTLAKCAYVVPDDCRPGVQPIGTAIPGAQAFVLGDGGRACGVGEVGEIVLRTPYRSLGYTRPSTADPWRPNPATDDPDDLLYRTGDLGRFRPDGLLDILGRSDRQVKIRGIRIEPDEIAAVIARHTAVEQAAVTATTDTGGELMLAAYLVAPGRTQATETQLRTYLGKRLPAVMVPSALLFVDAIPLTANGKTDWRALPEAAPAASVSYVAPRTGAERRVAEIVALLLRQDRVGAYDDFFALGGHSLLAMQLVSRLADAFGVTLPLRVVFEAPTIAGIAAALTEHAESADSGDGASADVGGASGGTGAT